jgi:hypothetical protein
MFDNYFEEKNFIFNYNKFYFKVERLELLSEDDNLNVGVYKYKISYFSKKNNKFKKYIFMVGKTVKLKEKYMPNPNQQDIDRIERYFETMKILKKRKIVSYSVRRFKDLENVECVNFDKIELDDIFFLKDLSLIGDVLPINKKDKFNSKIYEKYGEAVWMAIFEKMIINIVYLTKKNIYVGSLDVWLVIFNNKSIKLEIVDLDHFYIVNFIGRNELSELLVTVTEHLTEIINEDNFVKYDKIIKKYFNPFLKDMNLEIGSVTQDLCFDVVEL